MADIRRDWWWCVAAGAVAAGAAWLLTSPGHQARLGAHLNATMTAGAGPDPVSVPGGVAKWAPHTPASTGRFRHPSRHPGAVSPNITALQAGGYDWLFAPPSEGDL